jgi:MFS family permease
LRLVEPPPLSFVARQAWYPWLIVGVACVGAFIAQLDASVVQLALPTLAVEFQITLNQVSWVPIAYLLTLAGLLPVFGRLCEMWGRKAALRDRLSAVHDRLGLVFARARPPSRRLFPGIMAWGFRLLGRRSPDCASVWAPGERMDTAGVARVMAAEPVRKSRRFIALHRSCHPHATAG